MLRVVSFAVLVMLMGVSAAQAGEAAPTLKVSTVIESICSMATTDAKALVRCSAPTAYRVEVTSEPVMQQAATAGGTAERIASRTERVATVVF